MLPSTQYLLMLLGPFFCITGVALICNRKGYSSMIDELKGNAFMKLFTGMMMIIAGTAYVLYHNVWNSLPEILISLMGWLTLLKGAFYMLFPNLMMSMAEKMKPTMMSYLLLAGIVWTGVGAYFISLSY